MVGKISKTRLYFGTVSQCKVDSGVYGYFLDQTSCSQILLQNFWLILSLRNRKPPLSKKITTFF